MCRRCPSMIRAPWAPCLNICHHWGTAVSPICPVIPISIIRRDVCRRSGRSPRGANWNPSTSSSQISMPSRPRCLRWRCCVRRNLLLHLSTRRKFLPRPVCTPWPKHIPPGSWKQGRDNLWVIRTGCPLLSALKTASFVRRRTRQSPQRIVTPVNTVPKWRNCCSKCSPANR